MADANAYISASHCEATTKPTKVTNHQRTPLIDGKTVKIIQKTTSESLRLSMSNNPFDGGAAVNSNSNGALDTGYGGGVGGAIDAMAANSMLAGQQQQQQQHAVYGQRPVGGSLPAQTQTATLLMTNNGKLVQSGASPPFTLSDIGMDLKPKPSSYQITSITVGTRTSADDDSADDLDESHTTDENSRITDMENETPSYSEDTCSKDDVFAAAYAHGMVPIIQKSADLSNCVNNNMNNTNNNTINSSLNNNNNNAASASGGNGGGGAGNGGGSSGAKKMSAGEVRVSVATTVDKNKGVEIKGSERFKVVKIESIEPFKRGRWTCMDYLDQSAKQLQMNFGAGNGAAGGGGGAGSANAGAGGGSAPAAGAAAPPKNVTTSDSGVVLTDNFHCDASAAMLNNNVNSVAKKKAVKVVHTDMVPTQMNQSGVPVTHVVGQSAPVAIQTMDANMSSSPGQTLQQPLSAGHMGQSHVDAAGMLPTGQPGHIAYAANVTTANTFQPVNAIQPGQSLPQQQLHQLLSQQAQGVSIFVMVFFSLFLWVCVIARAIVEQKIFRYSIKKT